MFNKLKILKPLLFAVPIGITLMDYVGYITRVDGVSMQPTLNPNLIKSDYLFISTWYLRKSQIKRGDIVHLIHPADPKSSTIKRIIGIAGDIMVSMDSSKNDYFEIPKGHCWIEGDQLNSSFDSNSFGPIAIGLITGKALYIVWPPKRCRNLSKDLPFERRSSAAYKLII